MQQTQQNYNLVCGLVLAGWAVAAVAGAAHAGIAVRNAPEPLLHDGVRGDCDPVLAGPDYVPGVDVNGNPVRPADLARATNPVPDQILVPLAKRGRHGRSGEGPVVAIDGRSLDPILNPLPACPVKGR
ncbi:MAG: hypothetical protein V4559_07080 [Pseudomonadota bacterium]